MTRNELSLLLPLIMRERDYIEVTDAQANILRSANSSETYEPLIVLENASDTVNWKGETIPNVRTGHMRLWPLAEYELTANVRRKVKAKAEAIRAEHEASLAQHAKMREAIIAHFTKMNIPAIVITSTIIGNADSEKLQAIITGLRDSGAEITY